VFCVVTGVDFTIYKAVDGIELLRLKLTETK